MNKKYLINILKLIIFIFCLYYVSSKIDFPNTVNALKKANLLFYSFVFIIFTIGIILSAFKWNFILNSLKIKINFKTAFLIYLKGFFLNFFLPTSIGGDSLKIILIKKINKNYSAKSAFISVFFDRFSGLIALLFLLLISTIFIEENIIFQVKFFLILSIIFVFLMILILLLRKKIFFLLRRFIKVKKAQKIIYKFDKLFDNLFKEKHIILKILIISLLFHTMGIFAHYLLFISIGINIKIIFVYMMLSLSRIIDSFPISFGGIGVRESFLIYFSGIIGINSSYILAYSLLSYTLPVFMSIFYLIFNLVKRIAFKK